MNLNIRRLAKATLWGALFGIVAAYFGTYVDHLIESSPILLRDSRSEMFWWLEIPAGPGIASAIRTTHLDWHYDDPWGHYRHLIAIYNAVFYSCAFPVSVVIAPAIKTTLRRFLPRRAFNPVTN
jgi:hypothetical protein